MRQTILKEIMDVVAKTSHDRGYKCVLDESDRTLYGACGSGSGSKPTDITLDILEILNKVQP